MEACLAGASIDAAIAAERARGLLPPGSLADPVVDALRPGVETIVRQARTVLPAGVEPSSADVRVELPDGRLLSGTVTGVAGNLLRGASFSRRELAKHIGACRRSSLLHPKYAAAR